VLTPAGATNKHRYILATQSTALLTSLTSVPGLPIMHFNPRGVLVLSPPSTATVRAKNTAEEGRRLEGAKSLEELDEGDNVLGASAAAGPSKAAAPINLDAVPLGLGLGKRKVKGPNPLSVKKRKEAGPSGANDVKVMKGKRKRPAGDPGTEDAEDAGGEEGDRVEKAKGGSAAAAAPADGRKSKKKRKRKNKSEVAKAISELNATNEQGGGADEGDSD
jgi:U3 small nucleolar RNA-associated protein 23